MSGSVCISDRLAGKAAFDKVMSEQRPKCTERDSLVNISECIPGLGTGARPPKQGVLGVFQGC